MINNRITHRHLQRAGLLAAFGASAVAILSGCGGSSTNTGRAASVATPTVYGTNVSNGTTGSGIEFPVTTPATATTGPVTATTGGIVGALSSTAVPLEGTLPLGLPAGALESDNNTVGQVVPAGQPGVVFRALIANGNVGNASGAITGATLTSPEVTGFTQALTFTGVGDGPAASAGYTSPAFTLPFTTSGIHQFTATATDEGGQSGATTLGVVVVAATDSAVVVQIVTPDTSQTPPVPTPVAGATVSITNALPGVTAYNATATAPQTSVTDAQGEAVVFAVPGKQTITVTGTDIKGNPATGTDTQTLVAGQGLSSITTTSPYTITIPTPATTTAAVAKPHLVRRSAKH